MTITRGRCAVLINPEGDDAARVIDALWWHHRVRTIVVRTGDEPGPPLNDPEAVADDLHVGVHELDGLARHLDHHHQMAGVIPFSAGDLSAAITLARGMRRPWTDLDKLALTLDAAALKGHLATAAPELDVGPLSGTRYTALGQCDQNSAPVVVNVRRGGDVVAPSDPHFARARDFALAVMRALGLPRTPFEVSVDLDEERASLAHLDCALPALASRFDFLHGGRFSAWDWATHHWISDAPWGEPGLDWRRYGSFRTREVYGPVEEAGHVHRVEGAAVVEGTPYFWRWLRRPRVGDPLSTKREAWAVQLVSSADDEDQLAAAARAAQRVMAVHKSGTVKERAAVLAKLTGERALQEARRFLR